MRAEQCGYGKQVGKMNILCKIGDEFFKKTIWQQDNISLDTNTDYYSHQCFSPEEM